MALMLVGPRSRSCTEDLCCTMGGRVRQGKSCQGAICDYEVEMEAIRMVIEGIGTRVDEGLKGKPTSFFLLLMRF
jgi:hypothetical protein